jgi:hypothetical protein
VAGVHCNLPLFTCNLHHANGSVLERRVYHSTSMVEPASRTSPTINQSRSASGVTLLRLKLPNSMTSIMG